MREKYWVSYTLNKGLFYDRVVSIVSGKNGIDLPDLLREAIHPNKQGDPSDGLKGQISKDCVLLNFIKLK